MEFSIKSGAPAKQATACLILGVLEPRRLGAAAEAVDAAADKRLSALLRRGDMDGKTGQSLLLHNVDGVAAERVLLIGCGPEEEINDAKYRKIIERSVKQAAATGAADAISHLPELAVKSGGATAGMASAAGKVGAERTMPWKIYQAVLAAEQCRYEFRAFKSKKKSRRKSPLREIALATAKRETAAAETALRQARATANGVKLARDLGNRPANACTPTYLAQQAQALSRDLGKDKTRKPLKATVLNEAAMKKLGMHSLLSVSQGSAEPARLIAMEYRGGGRGDKPVVIVGKGVTFDTGGISIKPSAAMDEMKFDMCGAAAVFGVVRAVVEMELPVNLVGVVPATENMPSGAATKPGDIFTSMSGQTIEVLNTDAEGRLILCDALTYCARYRPAVVIDIATLTGACVVALGKHASGLMSNDEPLAAALLRAGETSGDRAWQLPLWKEYEKQIDSPFADMANVGGRDAGTITAACFLAKFARQYRWAHLDIAGTAWTSGKNKSATGRPVPLLVQYILDAKS